MNYRKILITVGDSPIAEKAVTVGYPFGQQLNAEIVVLSVVDNTSLMTDGRCNT